MPLQTACLRVPRAALLALIPLCSACERESYPTGPTGDAALNTLVTTDPINASSVDTLVKFSFTTGTVVHGSADWDIALRRYEVRLNGGISGTKGVVGYSLDNNKASTNDQVLAFTATGTREVFDSVRATRIPADTAFKADRLVANPTGFLTLTGVPAANAAAYWKVKLANGAFALLRVTAITMSQQFALTSVTVESRLQTGTSLGATQAVTVPVSGSTVSVSLTANQAVTANGCNWDISVNPQTFGMSLNTACNAGTYPGPASPTFATAMSASDAPEYGAFLSGMTGPIPNSVTDTSAPFRYNIQGDNRLSPTFNTYLIKSGTNVYKLQVINYYSAAGASAHPTLRYARIR